MTRFPRPSRLSLVLGILLLIAPLVGAAFVLGAALGFVIHGEPWRSVPLIVLGAEMLFFVAVLWSEEPE